MKYNRVSFSIEPMSETLAEILMAELAQFSYDSFEITETGLDAYIPTEEYDEKDILNLQIIKSNIAKISYANNVLEDKNWNETWEQNYFKPIIIDDLCTISSTFHQDVPKAKYNIKINPQMAFGSGNHETTRLMIQHISENNCKGKDVLDMGCGTGILGIFSIMLGAKSVVAIDIEEQAYKNTLENTKLNNIKGLLAKCGDASLLNSDDEFDIILANINRNILLNDIKNYNKVLNPKGLLMLSGFYDTDVDIINEECSKYGLTKISSKINNNWTSLVYQKK